MISDVPLPVRQRSVILVTPDTELRERVRARLLNMRWDVLTASGGAEAMAYLASAAPEAMVVDHWLPDLDAAEFVEHAAAVCPGTELLYMDGSPSPSNIRSTRRNELLHALREAQEGGGQLPVGAAAAGLRAGQAAHVQPDRGPATEGSRQVLRQPEATQKPEANRERAGNPAHPASARQPSLSLGFGPIASHPAESPTIRMHLPDMVGDSPAMQELGRMVRLVAPHAATVLVQGETGTGKELVAKAVHRLSARSAKPFVVLNCAAIPEHLLEAELFGHTRGAFTGAVASRVGRIEAAHGGTLFLDEIGEMPLALQAKMLRFLESGEVQRVGDNDSSRVDVRIVAATHQPLLERAGEKLFRLDLYHRLAVFPVEVPTLRSRLEDIPMLVEHFLRSFAENAPRKSIAQDALLLLHEYSWDGNVRELCHIMQRAVIMAGDSAVIGADHLRMRSASRD